MVNTLEFMTFVYRSEQQCLTMANHIELLHKVSDSVTCIFVKHYKIEKSHTSVHSCACVWLSNLFSCKW